MRERNEEMKEKVEAEELLRFKENKLKVFSVDKRKRDIQPPGIGEDKEAENAAKKRRVEPKSSGMEANGRKLLADLRRRMETERNWTIQRMDSWKLEKILGDLTTWWMETWSG